MAAIKNLRSFGTYYDNGPIPFFDEWHQLFSVMMEAFLTPSLTVTGWVLQNWKWIDANDGNLGFEHLLIVVVDLPVG